MNFYKVLAIYCAMLAVAWAVWDGLYYLRRHLQRRKEINNGNKGSD